MIQHIWCMSLIDRQIPWKQRFSKSLDALAAGKTKNRHSDQKDRGQKAVLLFADARLRTHTGLLCGCSAPVTIQT